MKIRIRKGDVSKPHPRRLYVILYFVVRPDGLYSKWGVDSIWSTEELGFKRMRKIVKLRKVKGVKGNISGFDIEYEDNKKIGYRLTTTVLDP